MLAAGERACTAARAATLRSTRSGVPSPADELVPPPLVAPPPVAPSSWDSLWERRLSRPSLGPGRSLLWRSELRSLPEEAARPSRGSALWELTLGARWLLLLLLRLRLLRPPPSPSPSLLMLLPDGPSASASLRPDALRPALSRSSTLGRLYSSSRGGSREPGHWRVEREGVRPAWLGAEGLLLRLLLAGTALLWGDAGTLLLFWLLSAAGGGDVFSPESLRVVWPGVSTRPFMASSLAAALRAEHLFPRTSGSGGSEGGALLLGVLGSCEAADFLVSLTEDESLPDSPPVDVLVLLEVLVSALRVRFLPAALGPRSRSWSCSRCLAERVSRCSFLLWLLSESEEDEGERERLLLEAACSFSPPSSFPPPASFPSSLPGSEELSTRLLLLGSLFS